MDAFLLSIRVSPDHRPSCPPEPQAPLPLEAGSAGRQGGGERPCSARGGLGAGWPRGCRAERARPAWHHLASLGEGLQARSPRSALSRGP